MVAGNIRSASSVSAEFGYETLTTFQTETTVYNLFGKKVVVGGLDFTNNQEALGQLNTPQITDFLYNSNRGSCSIDYVLSNPWVFSSVLNKWYTSSGSFIHTWSSDPSLNTNAKVPRSVSLKFIARLGAGNVSKLALGALCSSMSIRAAVEQPVSVSQSWIWGKETVGSLNTSVATENAAFVPHNFVNGQVQLPDATPITDVQAFNLTIDNGYTLLAALNSANAQDLYSKIFTLTGTVNLALQNATYLNYVVNRGPVASLSFTITDSNNTIKILLGQVSLSNDRWDGLSPGELLTEEFNFTAQSITVTATTSTDDPNAAAY